MSVQVKDSLSLAENKEVNSVLHPDGILLADLESVIWSGELIKINRRNTHQVRSIVLTNYKLINMGDDASLMENIMTFFSGTNIKRQIYYKKITHITYSETSNEFVIHVPSEYDYRFRSSKLRDEFIYYLLSLVFILTDKLVKIYFVEDLELKKYVTQEDPESDGRGVAHSTKYKEMMPEAFKAYTSNKNLRLFEDLKQTETILTRDGSKVNVQDFEFLRMLGKGGFGKVVLAEKTDSNNIYAIKIIEKAFLLQKENVSNILNEKEVLSHCEHPFLIRLEYCFHDPDRIYLVMKFMQGGELYHHLHHKVKFTEKE